MIRIDRFVAVLGSMFLTVLVARSAETQVDADCSNGGTTQREMNLCAQRAAEAAAAKLDALMLELESRFDEPGLAELKDVQDDWQALAEKDCQWQSGLFRPGSVAPLVYATCITELRELRIDRLERFLCEGMGMTGPCPASEKYESRQLSGASLRSTMPSRSTR